MVLEVPDSPDNEGLGMFMACMNVTGQDGAAIARSCKSSISQYRSPLLRSIETVAFAPGLVVGWAEQKQSVPVTFFATFHPDPHAPVREFHVEVKSKLVEVARASLHIEANLTGLRHLMYRHSWFSAVVGVGTNILVLMAIIGVSWYRFRQGGAGRIGSFEEEEAKDESEVEDIVEVQEINSAAPPQDGADLPAVGDQSMCNKLKWFFIRKTFKVCFTVNYFFTSLILMTLLLLRCSSKALRCCWSFPLRFYASRLSCRLDFHYHKANVKGYDAGLRVELGEGCDRWKGRRSCPCQLLHGQGEAAGCGYHGKDG